MLAIVLPALVLLPILAVLAVWVRRVRSGEYRRLWRPFETALRTGERPASIAPAAWAEFVAARRTGHRRAIFILGPAVLVYVVFVVASGALPAGIPHLTAVSALMFYLGYRLTRIERLAIDSVAPGHTAPLAD
ncbi:hypothetical protein [Nocardia sp. NPDC056000]|uniref:hypothetical protein n=1 Tax=Nocardia sp. NPDC056000 TaxID=3345674 RepID=UPI0035DD52F4